jgi:hypothetical protein
LETKLKAAAAAKRKYHVEGEGTVNKRMAQRWFKRFPSRNLSLEDEQRPGRSWIWDSEVAKELLNNSHQQVSADNQTHLALQRVLFIAI